MKALLLKNLVVEISDSEFPVHSDLVWMDAPEGCQYGWLLIDGELQAPAEEEISEDEKLASELPSDKERLDALWDMVVNNNNTKTLELNDKIEALNIKYNKKRG